MWNQITCKKLNEIYAIQQDSSLDAIDREIQTLCILTGNKKEFYESINLDALQREIEKTKFLSDLSSIPTKIPKWFICGGHLFDVNWELNKWNQQQRNDLKVIAGQFLDGIKAMEGSKFPHIDIIHKMVAIIAIQRPYWLFKGKYEGGKKWENLFYEKLPITVAYPLGVFFCNLSNALLIHIKTSLDSELKNLSQQDLSNLKPEEAEKLLSSIGDGLKSLTN